MALEIVQIPVLSDNYVYLLHDTATGVTGVVDPAVPDPVINTLEARGWHLDKIFNTHHHFDHVGANLDLKSKFDCEIIGPKADADRIPGIDTGVDEGETVTLGNHKAQVLFVPGHTRGHIAYWFCDDDALFIGDTLFAMGCGRLFEGTPEQMWTSLSKLSEMPDETRVFCAHEYTAANGEFALTLEPDNAALRARMDTVRKLRADLTPTVPSKLGEERATNPFLRANDPALMAAIGMGDADAVRVFAHIRAAKDEF